nr:hypothetical protein [Pandoravirus belohorizontensis]
MGACAWSGPASPPLLVLCHTTVSCASPFSPFPLALPRAVGLRPPFLCRLAAEGAASFARRAPARLTAPASNATRAPATLLDRLLRMGDKEPTASVSNNGRACADALHGAAGCIKKEK